MKKANGRPRHPQHDNKTPMRKAMLKLGVTLVSLAKKAETSYVTLSKADRGVPVRFTTYQEIEQLTGGLANAIEMMAEAHSYEPEPGPWLTWWNKRPGLPQRLRDAEAKLAAETAAA